MLKWFEPIYNVTIGQLAQGNVNYFDGEKYMIAAVYLDLFTRLLPAFDEA